MHGLVEDALQEFDHIVRHLVRGYNAEHWNQTLLDKKADPFETVGLDSRFFAIASMLSN